jgi:hypothetical protein
VDARELVARANVLQRWGWIMHGVRWTIGLWRVDQKGGDMKRKAALIDSCCHRRINECRAGRAGGPAVRNL